MAAIIQGGPAQPVQTSALPPDAGPAIPVAVLTEVEATARGVIAGPYRAVVEVADNRPRMAGAALPVIVGTGSGFAQAGPPMPVYVVSGSFAPPVSGQTALVEEGTLIALVVEGTLTALVIEA